MGDSGKLRFYELEHDESKMRLLKTHSHTSNGLALAPGTRKEKQLKETQTLQQGKSHPVKTCRVPPVWRGGAEKALEPAAYRRCGGGGAGKVLQQNNHRKGTMTRRALVDMEGNTSANTREKSCEKPPASHRHGGGVDEICGLDGKQKQNRYETKSERLEERCHNSNSCRRRHL